jgi:putative tryptophan/tyrosine transport system substrate-binding protein
VPPCHTVLYCIGVFGSRGALRSQLFLACPSSSGGNFGGNGALTWRALPSPPRRELVPHVKQIAVLAYWPHEPTTLLYRETSDAAEKLDVQVRLHKAGSIDEIENVFEIMAREGAEAVIVQQNAAWSSHLKRIADLANKRRLPAIHESSDFPSAGGLVSYGPSRFDLGRRAAFYVDKILKGASRPIFRSSSQ